MDHTNERVNPTLIQIRELIGSGRPDEGKTLLAKYLKANSLGAWDSIFLSKIYRSISEHDKALKILGPEFGPSELKNVTDDQLALQFRLAYMLQHNGARFLTERIFTNLTSEVQRRGSDPLSITPHYWRYVTAISLTFEDYANALTAAREALKTLSSDNPDWWGSKINEAAALFGLHEREACELLLIQLMEKSIASGDKNRAIIHLRFAMLYLDSNQWEKALQHGRDAERTLKNCYSLTYNNIYRTLGIYYSLQGAVASAVKYLNRCIETHTSMTPYTKMMNYYWLEQNLGKALPLSQRLATRAHSVFCPASYVLGKRYTHDKLPLSLHFGMKYIPNNNDCWVIDENDVSAARYSEIIHKYWTKTWPLMDLYSGVVLLPCAKTPMPILLTELQVKCVSSILGSGEIGISKWALTDFMYRQNFFHPTDGENRLKYLVQKLRQSGFDIKCENNIYSLDLPKNQVVILPMNHIGGGPQAILAILHPTFQRTHIESMFQISTSTAKGWIKEWLEEGIIESKGNGRNIAYHFISGTN